MPSWGRFTQPDPLGYAGGSNLYGYVGNDPLNAIDPLGLAPDSPQGPTDQGPTNQGPASQGPTDQSPSPSSSGAPTVSTATPDSSASIVTPSSGPPATQASMPFSPFDTGMPCLASFGGGGCFGGGSRGGGATGSAETFYGTPGGQIMQAPPGYSAVPAQNGKGLVLLPEGQPLGDNSNIIRYGEPNAQYPLGYFRYYNQYGQPVNPLTGRPGPNSETHISPTYQGPLMGYPGQ